MLDTGTDFNFAWSVPKDCPEWHNLTQIDDVMSGPCGIVKPKNVELLTYFFIAAPGLLLGFSALQQLFADLTSCGKAPVGVRILANTAAVFFEITLFFGFFVASALFNLWTKEVPGLGNGYEYTLKTIAYLSAASNLGVKFAGIFCHGPAMKHLVFQATDAETRYEAALQLALVISIYMNSGRSTQASVLSGITSILVIGKVGVQNYLGRQEKELTGTSVLGKFCLAFRGTSCVRSNSPLQNQYQGHLERLGQDIEKHGTDTFSGGPPNPNHSCPEDLPSSQRPDSGLHKPGGSG